MMDRYLAFQELAGVARTFDIDHKLVWTRN